MRGAELQAGGHTTGVGTGEKLVPLVCLVPVCLASFPRVKAVCSWMLPIPCLVLAYTWQTLRISASALMGGAEVQCAAPPLPLRGERTADAFPGLLPSPRPGSWRRVGSCSWESVSGQNGKEPEHESCNESLTRNVSNPV